MPANPIRELRESLGLTQKDLAELAGVTPQRVLREEQYVYELPSEKITNALQERNPSVAPNTLTLVVDYVRNRNQLHRDFSRDLTESPFYEQHLRHAVDYATDYWDALSELRSPTKMFRASLFEQFGLPDSAIKFTIYTGMHPGTLSDIETGKTDWDGAVALKEVFRNALHVPGDLMSVLGILHDQYFMRKVH